MDIKPNSNRMYGFLVLYDMQTTFYHSVLDGINDEDALKRLDTKANHINWLAGSLLQERFELANLLGVDLKSSADELFKYHQGIKDVAYPTLKTYEAEWDKISPVLREKLVNVSDEELDKVIDFEVEQMSFPLFEMVSFNTYREANCIGQIALWRRLLGYEAMKYM
ncbi:MAG: DinB family protein [Pedobacter sp.]|uniref:DinB family protein n=1 Tax=Pedobacter sp. TaxID=1411316 RepID=UPI0028090523|nr:DinB family protein [Pedobacter sp.]MDQ8005822.1 DinB family protein [Pedobacter sp.]